MKIYVLLIIFPTILFSFSSVAAEGEIDYKIISVESLGSEKWVVKWDVCANKDVRTFFRISSDIDLKHIGFSTGHLLYAGKCLQDYFDHPITTIIKAYNPATIKIEVAEFVHASDSPRIIIQDAIPSKIPNKYTLLLNICAGKEQIRDPLFVVYSDIDEEYVTISGVVMAPMTCINRDMTIRAENKNLIDAQFVITDRYKKLEQEKIIEKVPSWVKHNAKWWADGHIGDDDFVQGIQYLITQEIIKISETTSGSGASKDIPLWIKNNARWWSDGLITEDDFVKGIEYLVSNGVIRVG